MRRLPALSDRPRGALVALRVTVALLVGVHGVARVGLGIVDDFGGFLEGFGFPLGVGLAWAITVGEIVGGVLLVAGRWVRPVALTLALELAVGVALVHAAEGWFVVGAGRNGMEYSVLLIAVLLAVAYASGPDPAPESTPPSPRRASA